MVEPAALAALLYPLRPEHFAILGFGYQHNYPEDPAEYVYQLLAALPKPPKELSVDAVRTVIAKVKKMAPTLLPPRGPELRDPSHEACILPAVAACVLCHGTLLLDPEPRTVKALTFANGLVPVSFKTSRCKSCKKVYADCWMWSPSDIDNRELSAMRVVSNPHNRNYFMILQQPKKVSIAFVDKELLKLCSHVVLYLRGNFEGISNVWQALFRRNVPPSLECDWRKRLLPAWLVWRSVCILWSKHESAIRKVDFTLDWKHRYNDVYETYGALTPLLRQRHLDLYARDHSCATCSSVQSVGFDNKCGFTTEVCAFPLEGTRKYTIGVEREFGCENAHVVGKRFCACHSKYEQPEEGGSGIVCPQNHALHERVLEDIRPLMCGTAVCGASIYPGRCYHRCDHACDFVLCEGCYETALETALAPPTVVRAQKRAVPKKKVAAKSLSASAKERACSARVMKKKATAELRRSARIASRSAGSGVTGASVDRVADGGYGSSAGHRDTAGETDEVHWETATDGADDLDNFCGIKKTEGPVISRRYGGLITAILSCGIVAFAELSGGCESYTQIYGMAGDIMEYRNYKYIVYDSACVLQRYIWNKTKTLQTELANRLGSIICVLDRYHKRKHTACLDPGHRGYLRSVDIGIYTGLAEASTSLNESWNSWIDGFAAVVQSMHPRTLGIYTFILLDLWNERLLGLFAYQGRSVQLPAPGPKRRSKKRNRGSGV